jgi:uncharacterized protein (TIGR02266 family)
VGLPRRKDVARAPRAAVTVMVRHRGAGADELVSDYAEDISTSGLFVSCDEPYMVGTAVELHIAPPAGGATIAALGRVVRVGVGHGGTSGMGIMFVSLDDEARALVERVVALGLARDDVA